MRIVFLTQANILANSGVKKKIVSTVQYWGELGHKVLLLSFYSEEPNPQERVNTEFTNVTIKTLRFSASRYFPFKPLRNYTNKIFSASTAKEEIIKWNPDIIYYRHGTWFPSLSHILKVAPTVIEINTIDEYEMKFYSFPRMLATKWFNRKLLNLAEGHIYISNEIADFYKNYNKKNTVIANGFRFKKQVPKRSSRISESANLVFIWSEYHPWHGIDKVLQLASKLSHHQFHLIGPNCDCDLENVQCHGLLGKNEIDKLLMEMDIGIGTLSLYKKNLLEASPLKVRHYLSLGLPVIVGYEDTDLKDEPYILNIGNTEQNVELHLEIIDSFIKKWKGKSVPYDEVYHKLDYSVKEAKRLNFFEEICKNANTASS